MLVDDTLEFDVPGAEFRDGRIPDPGEEEPEPDDVPIKDPVDTLGLFHPAGRDTVPVSRHSAEKLSEIRPKVTEPPDLV